MNGKRSTRIPKHVLRKLADKGIPEEVAIDFIEGLKNTKDLRDYIRKFFDKGFISEQVITDFGEGINNQEELKQSLLRQLADKGLLNEEMLEELLEHTNAKNTDNQGRKNVISVRLSDEALLDLDDLITADVVKSRSEAASFLIEAGIKHCASMIENIRKYTSEIEKIQQQMKQSIKDHRLEKGD